MNEHHSEILFGLEIGFLFAMEDSRLLDRLEESTRIDPLYSSVPTHEEFSRALLGYVTYLLNRYGLGDHVPVETRLSSEECHTRHPQGYDLNLWDVTTDESLQTVVDFEERLHLSETQSHQPFWHVRGVQLVSPVLELLDIDCWALNLQRLQRVLKDTESRGQWGDWGYKPYDGAHMAFLNETCGLHVQMTFKDLHVPLGTLQNLIIMWALFEKDIERFQPQHHRTSQRPLPSLLGRFGGEIGRKLFFKAVRACQDHEQLLSYIRPLGSEPEHSKISLISFDDPIDGRRLRTIKFREHAGTLDGNAIKWWVILTSGVLRFAQMLTDANLIFDASGKVSIGDLFELIHFPAAGRQHYYRSILRNKS